MKIIVRLVFLTITFIIPPWATASIWDPDDIWGDEKEEFPPVDSFLVMPYDIIHIGTESNQLVDITGFPYLNSGEILAYCRGPKGKAKRLMTQGQVEFSMQQPQHHYSYLSEERRGGISVKNSNWTLSEFTSSGSLQVQKSAFALSVFKGGSGMATKSSLTAFEELSKSGRVISSVAIRRQSAHELSGGLTTTTKKQDTTVKIGSGKEKSLSLDKGMSMQRNSGGDFSVSSLNNMLVAEGKDGLNSKLSALILGHKNDSGKHFSLDDYSELLTSYEEIFLNALIEHGLDILGISEGDFLNAFEDGMFEPTQEEIESFSEILLQDGDLDTLVNRQFSEPFLPIDYESQLGGEEIETSFHLLPEPRFHGSLGALYMTISNKGTKPIYDLLMIVAVPENTEFTHFLNPTPYARGYLNEIHSASKSIVIKLYRPIMPGQTFSNIILLTMDKWLVSTSSTTQ